MVCSELLPQTDVGALYSQLKQLQRKNAEMEEHNRILSTKVFFFCLPPFLAGNRFPCSSFEYTFFFVNVLQLQTTEVEKESLEARLNVLVSYSQAFVCDIIQSRLWDVLKCVLVCG